MCSKLHTLNDATVRLTFFVVELFDWRESDTIDFLQGVGQANTVYTLMNDINIENGICFNITAENILLMEMVTI
jgi:hypothetical protein